MNLMKQILGIALMAVMMLSVNPMVAQTTKAEKKEQKQQKKSKKKQRRIFLTNRKKWLVKRLRN